MVDTLPTTVVVGKRVVEITSVEVSRMVEVACSVDVRVEVATVVVAVEDVAQFVCVDVYSVMVVP
jgi:hypothetical protein